MSELRTLVGDFANKLASLIDAEVLGRARAAVDAALGGASTRRVGRPPKTLQLASGRKRRRKGPLQLCPVPGCKNPAAPVFGMVCAKHKDVPKAKIRQFREARRAKKLKAAA